MALIFTSLINVTYAYSQEIAKTTPYYSHPVTGVIEDPGNNPGIGQGMTENVVSPQALVETTDDGRIFLSDLLRKGGFTDRRAKFYKIKFGILLILTVNYYKINTHNETVR